MSRFDQRLYIWYEIESNNSFYIKMEQEVKKAILVVGRETHEKSSFIKMLATPEKAEEIKGEE